MNNPDHISESFFWVKILRFFDADAGDLGSGIRDGKNSDPGSAKNSSILTQKLFLSSRKYDPSSAK
jgi:hypothetical protein